MKDKALKHLNRADLLEILIRQNKEIESLQARLQQTEEKLHAKELQIQECGSLAESALKLNGVFEAAQAACEQYIANVRSRAQAADAQELDRLEASVQPKETLHTRQAQLEEMELLLERMLQKGTGNE